MSHVREEAKFGTRTTERTDLSSAEMRKAVLGLVFGKGDIKSLVLDMMS